MMFPRFPVLRFPVPRFQRLSRYTSTETLMTTTVYLYDIPAYTCDSDGQML